MSIKFVKLLLPNTLLSIVDMFNNIFTSCTYSDSWKVAIVIPVGKTNKPANMSKRRILWLQTNQAAAAILKDIRPAYDRDRGTILVTIDFSKALRTVDHSQLISY